MPIEIKSPYRFQERITAFGYEGAGKSSLILNILKYQLDAHGWIIDLDYSFAYDRLIQMEYPEVEDRAHVFGIDQEWGEFVETFEKILTDGDPKRGDWLCIDPTTATWTMVQSFFVGTVYDEDLGEHLVGLKKKQQEAKEAAKTEREEIDAKKQFGRDQVEDMSWPVINKLYQDNFYSLLHKWRGNFILVCEAEALRKDATDKEKEMYGWLGHKPRGQKTLPYVAATNIYLEHVKVGKEHVWKMTTTKDRGRAMLEKEPFEDFALDYLVDVAGWEKSVRKSNA